MHRFFQSITANPYALLNAFVGVDAHIDPADCTVFTEIPGEIVQQGTHDDLINADGLYRRFVVERRQAAGWKVRVSPPQPEKAL